MEGKSTILIFVSIFLLVQGLGLYIGNIYIGLIQANPDWAAFQNPNDIGNSLFLIVYLLAVTAVIIVIIRYKKVFLRVLEAVVVFLASFYTFLFLLPATGIAILDDYLVLPIIIALSLTSWKMLRPSILNQNLALIFSITGAGAILGASLGIVPVLIFVVFLSIYDFISVFITKHMVYIAKEIVKTPTAFTAAIPTKFKKAVLFSEPGGKKVKKKIHVFQLGGGDIAIPLVFAVSVLSSFDIYHSLFVVAGAAISLTLLIYYVLNRPGRVLPALPWISSGMIASFLISLVLLL